MSSDEARYQVDAVGGVTIVAIRPPLNDAPWSEIEDVGTQLLSQLPESRPSMAVDLTPLTYMPSAVVALIVRLWKAVREKNGQMIIINTDPMVLEILELSGLTKVWTIVESRDAALRQMGQSPTAGPSGTGSSSLIITIVALIALVGAGVGLGLVLWKDAPVRSQVALAIEFVFAAVSLISGTLTAVSSAGGRRGFGIFVVVASLAMIIVGILNLPKP